MYKSYDSTVDYGSLPRPIREGGARRLTPDTLEDTLLRLEANKDNLKMQVGVLTEQVEYQGGKIDELEENLEEKKSKLANTESLLHRELLSRTSLETHKLDMMAEISSLKIKLSTAEKSKRELEDKLFAAQRHILDLESHMSTYTTDYRRAQRNGMTSPVLDSSGEAASSANRPLERERTLERLKRKHTEVEKLKRAVDSLVLSNDEKDKRLNDMNRVVRRYKRVEDYVIQSQGRKLIDEILSGDDDSSTSSMTPSTGYESAARDNSQTAPTNGYGKSPFLPSPNATSTPVAVISPEQKAATLTRNHDETPRKRPPAPIVRSNSCEDVSKYPTKTPPNLKRNHTTSESSRNHVHAIDSADGYHGNGLPGHTPPDVKKKRGLKRFLGKLRRSSSTDLEASDHHEEFRRGGVRATAGARLGWSRELKTSDDFTQNFARWDCDKVMSWMYNIGLNMYVIDCKRWVKNGDQLLRATPHQLEKELNMKNTLHKKKLQLALQAVTSGHSDQFKNLDHNWVTGWLDDIGLPQYKETFHESRIDGRMLNSLTVDDLLTLRVTNSLHHLSIKQGIHILRSNFFSTAVLKRRPLSDEVTLRNVPDEVCLWTNHRVMEWLRTIDLSEYAPNLRGSGVHGALMVLEPRFTAELFSLVLSIPQNKTLLRRHLKTHFISLVGNDVQHKKREMEATPNYMPLMPTSKVKQQRKFGLFAHRRSKSESEYDDFVCPIDASTPSTLTNGSSQVNGHHTPLDIQTDPRAAKEIGAVSKEITSMTTRLTDERFMQTVQTSTV